MTLYTLLNKSILLINNGANNIDLDYTTRVSFFNQIYLSRDVTIIKINYLQCCYGLTEYAVSWACKLT